jgi:hypothetical protein
MTAGTSARIAAVLLVVTAVLFVIGVSQESGDEHNESTEETHAEGEATGEGENGESAEQREAEGHDEAGESAGGEERQILGLDPESPGLVAVAVVVSLALAAGLWFTAKRGVAAAAAGFAAVFALLDAAEVSHQLDEDRNGLATLAVAIAIGHALAALTAGRAALRPDTTLEVS